MDLRAEHLLMDMILEILLVYAEGNVLHPIADALERKDQG